jgi:hypothetical protein
VRLQAIDAERCEQGSRIASFRTGSDQSLSVRTGASLLAARHTGRWSCSLEVYANRTGKRSGPGFKNRIRRSAPEVRLLAAPAWKQPICSPPNLTDGGDEPESTQEHRSAWYSPCFRAARPRDIRSAANRLQGVRSRPANLSPSRACSFRSALRLSREIVIGWWRTSMKEMHRH